MTIENKGWELVAEAERYADDVIVDMADSIYFSSPENRPAPPPPVPPAK